MSAEEPSLEEQIRDLLRGRGIPYFPESPRPQAEDGACRLVVHFYGGRSQYRCSTIREAVQRAIYTLGAGEAWPVKIEQGTEVLWELDETRDSRHTLERLLQAHP